MQRDGNDTPKNGSARSPQTPSLEGAWIRRREVFYERAIGPLRPPGIYHWPDDDDPHIDVYVFGGGPDRPYETMITGGMADRPMPGLFAGRDADRRVEVLVSIPRAGLWLAQILREIASVPFRYNSFLSEGALIKGTRPIREDSLLRHAVLANAREEALDRFVVEGEIVRFLTVLFITDEELAFGDRQGGAALLRRLEEAGVPRVLEVTRKSVL
jgi:hypothetical protein